MRKDTAYQLWIKSKFLGDNAKNSIDLVVDNLLQKANQNSLPIKLSSVAKIIGIDPKPLYFDQPYDGSLITINDRLRIALNLSFRQNHRFSQRIRFTYAHELIHCLAYDFKNLPHKRIAPMPDGMEEEHLCNYGAAKLILPTRILSQYFTKAQNIYSYSSSGEKIRFIANEAGCSITTVVIELITSSLLSKENRLYILSLNSNGYQNKGDLKPRCLVGVFFENGIKRDFLASNKGLEHIKIIGDNLVPWSLLQFHNDHSQDYLEIKNENIIRMTDGSLFIINGTHVRLNEKGYVWSELSYVRSSPLV